MSDAWKALERLVAAVLGGVRAYGTDHDVLVVTKQPEDFVVKILDETHGGEVLLILGKAGHIELASIEVKNLKGPTVAQLEGYLKKNREKADRDGVKYSALVVKRKAGRGVETMPLLVVPLLSFAQAVDQSILPNGEHNA